MEDSLVSGNMHLALASATIGDAFNEAGTVHVYYQRSKDAYVATYNLDPGTIDKAGTEVLVLAHDTSTGSYEKDDGISGLSVQRCVAISVTDDPLNAVSGPQWEASHIGISPNSITVSGTGCTGAPTYAGLLKQGWSYGGTTVQDRFNVNNTTGCTTVTASYLYTDCSFYDSGDTTAAHHCTFPSTFDPDSDSTTTGELGFCRLFMVYEAITDLDSGQENHHFFLAHAQQPRGPWTRYLPGSDTIPNADDVVLFNTGPHTSTDPGGTLSFTGVPGLVWDPMDQAWRMWFAGDAYDEAGVMYSESDDDGKTWGIGSSASGPDCWDTGSGQWDTTVCEFVGWSTSPGPVPNVSGTAVNPDLVDPDVVLADVSGDTALELLLFGTGADNGCTPAENGVILVSEQDLGDSLWTWNDSVYADTLTGVVLEQRGYNCPSDDTTTNDRVADPTGVTLPLPGGGVGYIMFFQMDGKIYVSGSGFQCSNWIDDDADSLVDYGADSMINEVTNCQSPTDNSE